MLAEYRAISMSVLNFLTSLNSSMIFKTVPEGWGCGSVMEHVFSKAPSSIPALMYKNTHTQKLHEKPEVLVKFVSLKKKKKNFSF